MPRGDTWNHGGRRVSTRPDAKKAGRPKAFATVRIPIEDASAVLDILLAQHNTMQRGDTGERGMAFLIAGLQAELVSK